MNLLSRFSSLILSWTGVSVFLVPLVSISPKKDAEKTVLLLHSISLRGHFETRISHLEGLLKVASPESSAQVVKRALADAYAAGAVGTSGSTSNTGETSYSESMYNANDKYSESPEPSQSGGDGDGDEAAGAAFALEVLAGGDQTMSIDSKPSHTYQKNPQYGQRPGPSPAIIPLEIFAKTSVLAADSNARLEGNSRIPLLGFLNRRNITDSILACLQTK